MDDEHPEPAVEALPVSPMPAADEGDEGAVERPSVAEPDKVLRIATMVRQLLEETRQAPPDERGRIMLRDAYERAVKELADVLSPTLVRELDALAPAIEGVPTESEIRVAQALLMGWLEGLFHGIQAAMWAQQVAAQTQFEELRRRSLPPGSPMGPPPGPGEQHPPTPGQYL